MKNYSKNRAKHILRSELAKRGLKIKDLIKLLVDNGEKETSSSIYSKVNRGTFSASFFITCLSVIGCEEIRVKDYN